MDNNKSTDLLALTLSGTDPVHILQDQSLTTDTVRLKDKDFYKSKESIKNTFVDKEGNFDDKAFNKFYDQNLELYNKLEDDRREKVFYNTVDFYDYGPVSQDELHVTKKKKEYDINPYGVLKSGKDFNVDGAMKYSIDEIAQRQPVFNGKEFESYTAESRGFFDNMFSDPMALAQYEQDEFDEQGNITHHKGEFKFNDAGKPYYEYLNGKNPADRQVLSKLNVITEEDSIMNKWDPFENDGLDKSIIKSTATGLLKLSPILLAAAGKNNYKSVNAINKLFTAAYGVQQFSDMGVASINAMYAAASGKESEKLNNLRGWAKSYTFGKSQNSKEDMFTFENLVDTVTDSFWQLRSLGMTSSAVGWMGSKAGLTGAALDNAVRWAPSLMMSAVTAGELADMGNRAGIDKTSLGLLTGAAMFGMFGLYQSELFDFIRFDPKQGHIRNVAKTALKEMDDDLARIASPTATAMESKNFLQKYKDKIKTAFEAQRADGFKDLTYGGVAEGLEEMTEVLINNGLALVHDVFSDKKSNKFNVKASAFAEELLVSGLGGFIGGMAFQADRRWLSKIKSTDLGFEEKTFNDLIAEGYGKDIKRAIDTEAERFVSKSLSFNTIRQNNQVLFTPSGALNPSQYDVLTGLLKRKVDSIQEIMEVEGVKSKKELYEFFKQHNGDDVTNAAFSTINSEVGKFRDKIISLNEELGAIETEQEQKKDANFKKARVEEIHKELNEERVKLAAIYKGERNFEFFNKGMFYMNKQLRESFGIDTKEQLTFKETGKSYNELDATGKADADKAYDDYKNKNLDFKLESAFAEYNKMYDAHMRGREGTLKNYSQKIGEFDTLTKGRVKKFENLTKLRSDIEAVRVQGLELDSQIKELTKENQPVPPELVEQYREKEAEYLQLQEEHLRLAEELSVYSKYTTKDQLNEQQQLIQNEDGSIAQVEENKFYVGDQGQAGKNQEEMIHSTFQIKPEGGFGMNTTGQEFLAKTQPKPVETDYNVQNIGDANALFNLDQEGLELQPVSIPTELFNDMLNKSALNYTLEKDIVNDKTPLKDLNGTDITLVDAVKTLVAKKNLTTSSDIINYIGALESFGYSNPQLKEEIANLNLFDSNFDELVDYYDPSVTDNALDALGVDVAWNKKGEVTKENLELLLQNIDLVAPNFFTITKEQAVAMLEAKIKYFENKDLIDAVKEIPIQIQGKSLTYNQLETINLQALDELQKIMKKFNTTELKVEDTEFSDLFKGVDEVARTIENKLADPEIKKEYTMDSIDAEQVQNSLDYLNKLKAVVDSTYTHNRYLENYKKNAKMKVIEEVATAELEDIVALKRIIQAKIDKFLDLKAFSDSNAESLESEIYNGGKRLLQMKFNFLATLADIPKEVKDILEKYTAPQKNDEGQETLLEDAEYEKAKETLLEAEVLLHEALQNIDLWKIGALNSSIPNAKGFNGKLELTDEYKSFYIATLKYMNPKVYYNLLNQVNADLKIVPFSGQEEVIKHLLGIKYKGSQLEEISKKLKAENDILVQKAVDGKIVNAKEDLVFSDRIIGVPGVGGSGKSSAVANMLANMNRKLYPDAITYLYAPNQTQLDNLSGNIQVEENKARGTFDSLIADLESGVIRHNDMIIMDESTYGTPAQMKKIAELAEAKDVIVFALYDNNQSGNFAKYTGKDGTVYETDANIKEMSITVLPKLMASVRSGWNTLQYSLRGILDAKESSVKTNVSGDLLGMDSLTAFRDTDIKLFYDPAKAIGVYNVSYNNTRFDEFNKFIEEKKKNGETVVAIYDDEESKSNNNGKIKADKHLTVAEAQGSEYDNVIYVDDIKYDSVAAYTVGLPKLYTGLSRAKKAVLFATNDTIGKFTNTLDQKAIIVGTFTDEAKKQKIIEKYRNNNTDFLGRIQYDIKLEPYAGRSSSAIVSGTSGGPTGASYAMTGPVLDGLFEVTESGEVITKVELSEKNAMILHTYPALTRPQHIQAWKDMTGLDEQGVKVLYNKLKLDFLGRDQKFEVGSLEDKIRKGVKGYFYGEVITASNYGAYETLGLSDAKSRVGKTDGSEKVTMYRVDFTNPDTNKTASMVIGFGPDISSGKEKNVKVVETINTLFRANNNTRFEYPIDIESLLKTTKKSLADNNIQTILKPMYRLTDGSFRHKRTQWINGTQQDVPKDQLSKVTVQQLKDRLKAKGYFVSNVFVGLTPSKGANRFLEGIDPNSTEYAKRKALLRYYAGTPLIFVSTRDIESTSTATASSGDEKWIKEWISENGKPRTMQIIALDTKRHDTLYDAVASTYESTVKGIVEAETTTVQHDKEAIQQVNKYNSDPFLLTRLVDLVMSDAWQADSTLTDVEKKMLGNYKTSLQDMLNRIDPDLLDVNKGKRATYFYDDDGDRLKPKEYIRAKLQITYLSMAMSEHIDQVGNAEQFVADGLAAGKSLPEVMQDLDNRILPSAESKKKIFGILDKLLKKQYPDYERGYPMRIPMAKNYLKNDEYSALGKNLDTFAMPADTNFDVNNLETYINDVSTPYIYVPLVDLEVSIKKGHNTITVTPSGTHVPASAPTSTAASPASTGVTAASIASPTDDTSIPDDEDADTGVPPEYSGTVTPAASVSTPAVPVSTEIDTSRRDKFAEQWDTLPAEVKSLISGFVKSADELKAVTTWKTAAKYNIISRSSNPLLKALTNPSSLNGGMSIFGPEFAAIGNGTFPISINNRTFIDAEAAYQAGAEAGGFGRRGRGPKVSNEEHVTRSVNVMLPILEAKFRDYPVLAQAIEVLGGTDGFLNEEVLRHNLDPNKPVNEKPWETDAAYRGYNNIFLKTLIQAYKNVRDNTPGNWGEIMGAKPKPKNINIRIADLKASLIKNLTDDSLIALVQTHTFTNENFQQELNDLVNSINMTYAKKAMDLLNKKIDMNLLAKNKDGKLSLKTYKVVFEGGNFILKLEDNFELGLDGVIKKMEMVGDEMVLTMDFGLQYRFSNLSEYRQITPASLEAEKYSVKDLYESIKDLGIDELKDLTNNIKRNC